MIFKIPQIAWLIENILWINWFNQFVLSFKSTWDDIFTNIPNNNELNDAFDNVYSWALDFKTKFEDWLGVTKDKIDWFRETASGIENTYNELKDTYDKAKGFIESNSWTIDDIKEVIETISDRANIVTNTWETN